MKIYYTGRLVESDLTKNSDFYISYSAVIGNPDYETKERLQLNISELNFLKDHIGEWKNVNSGITDKQLIEILDKAWLDFSYYNRHIKRNIIFELIEDESGNLYGKEYITGFLFPVRDKIEDKKYIYRSYIGNDLETHKILRNDKFTDENLAKFKVILFADDIATKNQIEKYENKFKSIWSTNRYRKKLEKIYNENVFKKEIIEKKEKVFENQNELTEIMENIEYSLSILKSKNEDAYNHYLKKYNSIINGKYFDNKSLKKELLNLTIEIKLTSLIINSNNLEEYLNNSIKNYLDKLLNNSTTINDISIYDLDKITELFLKYKDNYDIQYQRNILKKISLLYLLIVKNNNDNFSEKDFNESYFKHNLKSIILNISILQDLGIIKNNKDIDISIEPNISNILSIIKEIEFNSYNEEHIKKLIK